MTKPITHTVLILDQSGSMDGRQEFAVNMYNELVQQAQLMSKDDNQEILVSLLTFNGSVFEHLWNVPAEQLKLSTRDDYHCDGSTALNDAIGYAVTKLLATTEKDNPNVGYSIQVVTDGEENQSVRYGNKSIHYKTKEGLEAYRTGAEELSELVKEVKKTGRWTFAFMGCSGQYLETMAKNLGMEAQMGNFATYNPNNAGGAVKTAAMGAHRLYAQRATGQHVNSGATPYFGGVASAFSDLTEAEEKTCGVALASASASIGDVSLLACNVEAAKNVFTSNTPVNLNIVYSTTTSTTSVT